jgi:PAS domain S-box-containing protein
MLPLVVVGYLLANINFDALKNLTREFYISVTTDVTHTAIADVDNAKIVLDKFNFLLGSKNLRDDQKIELLKAEIASSSVISAIGIYEPSGNLLDVIQSKTDSLAMPVQLSHEFVSSETVFKIGRATKRGGQVWPQILIVRQWLYAGKLQGYLAASLDTRLLCESVGTASQRYFSGKPDRIYIVAEAFQIIAHSDTARLLKPIMPELQASIGITGRGEKNMKQDSLREPSSYFYQDVASSGDYEAKDRETHQNITMLYSYKSIPQLHWGLIIEQPASEAYASVTTMRRQVVAWGLFSLVAAAGLGILLSRRISRPIAELASGAKQLAAQNFSINLPVGTNDELGFLTQTFNNTAQQLKVFNDLNIDKIISEKTKLEQVVRQVTDGIIVVDAQQNVVIVNQAVEAWFHVKNETVAERPFREVIGNAAFAESIAQTFLLADDTTGEPAHTEIKIKEVGKIRETILQAVFARVHNQDGKFVAAVGVLRDITREKEIDRMKTELVSIVAHELRTPLNAISGFSQILLQQTMPAADTKKYSKIISDESTRLATMITKFLDISRIESGKTEIRRIPFRLEQVLQSVLAVNTNLAQQKKMVIDVKLPNKTTPILGDPDLIGQVFLNFYSNAVKYSDPEKTIRIDLTEKKDEMMVSVTDQGYGISQTSLEKMFEKFFRAGDDARVQTLVGTGLGLAYSKEVIEQHGGKIGVESVINQGSTFWFSLPKLSS